FLTIPATAKKSIGLQKSPMRRSWNSRLILCRVGSKAACLGFSSKLLEDTKGAREVLLFGGCRLTFPCAFVFRLGSGRGLNGCELLDLATQFFEGNFLDLADALARKAKIMANLVQRLFRVAVQPETMPQDFRLARL